VKCIACYVTNTARLRYGPKTNRKYTQYCLKCAVCTTFTVRFPIVSDTVLIGIGNGEMFFQVSTVQEFKENFNLNDIAQATGNFRPVAHNEDKLIMNFEQKIRY